VRSCLREDSAKPGHSPTPQFLFWFNESPGLYTPGPAISSQLASCDFSRARASQRELVPFREFTEHQEDSGHFADSASLYNFCRVLHYGAILAVGYNIFHDKTLSRAVQDWYGKFFHLDPHIPELLESHCPVLAVKHKKTALAQPLGIEVGESHTIRKELCECALASQLYNEVNYVNEKEPIEEASETSDYSSQKSESNETYQFSREELSLLELQNCVPQSVEALVAIQLLKKGEKEGIDTLKHLSAHGCSVSQFFLGQAYEQGVLVSKDLVEAARYYKEAADRGHLEAKYNLGVFYLRGEGGCECSEAKGMKLIQEAAELGLLEALMIYNNIEDKSREEIPAIDDTELEELYHMGQVMEESEPDDSVDQLFALELYKAAAEKGHKGAEKSLKILSQKISSLGSQGVI